jgi:hypothetical protein
MGFSTPSKLYHSTQIFQKWNKNYFSLRANILACNLSTVHVKCANKINITCPYGHINTLYLRTCTFLRSLASRRRYSLTLLFSAACLNVNLCPEKVSRDGSVLSVENFASLHGNCHEPNKVSCLGRSPSRDIRTLDSWLLMPIPCLRHNLLTNIEIRFL